MEMLVLEARAPALSKVRVRRKNQTRLAKEEDHLRQLQQALSRRWPLPVRARPLRGCQPLLLWKWPKMPALWLVLSNAS